VEWSCLGWIFAIVGVRRGRRVKSVKRVGKYIIVVVWGLFTREVLKEG
jgi:hypothetical protein